MFKGSNCQENLEEEFKRRIEGEKYKRYLIILYITISLELLQRVERVGRLVDARRDA